MFYTDPDFDLQQLVCEAIAAEKSGSLDSELSDLSELSESDNDSDTLAVTTLSVTIAPAQCTAANSTASSSSPHTGTRLSISEGNSSTRNKKRKRSANNAAARRTAHHAARRTPLPAVSNPFVPLNCAAREVNAVQTLPETLNGTKLSSASTAFQGIRHRVEKVAWKLAEILGLGFRYQSWDGRCVLRSIHLSILTLKLYSHTLAVVDKQTEVILAVCAKKVDDPSWDNTATTCAEELENLRPRGYYPNPQPGDPHQKREPSNLPSKAKKPKVSKTGKTRKPKVKDPEMRGVFNYLSSGISTDGGQKVSNISA